MSAYKAQLERARKALLDGKGTFSAPTAQEQVAQTSEGLMRPRQKPQESQSAGMGFGMALMSSMSPSEEPEVSSGGLLGGPSTPGTEEEEGRVVNGDAPDLSQYAVGGAALRDDSFTGLDSEFATGVHGLTQAAHAAGIPLQITSAYRSPATQANIIERGMANYGLGDRSSEWRADVTSMGPEAAGRKWRPIMRSAGLTRFIAMPGTSQHQRGTAVDFATNGRLIRDANSPEARFIRDNAGRFGLSVPMSWEPWQVEPTGSRG
mgnify:FL=1|tara:strand:+ start:1717 stop:2505 length:789 start_codon:yes stop_codon:yes gene_type:complete